MSSSTDKPPTPTPKLDPERAERFVWEPDDIIVHPPGSGITHSPGPQPLPPRKPEKPRQ